MSPPDDGPKCRGASPGAPYLSRFPVRAKLTRRRMWPAPRFHEYGQCLANGNPGGRRVLEGAGCTYRHEYRDDQCGIGLIGLGAAALTGRFGTARGWLCCSVYGRTSARRVGTRCRARRLAVLLLGNCRMSGWPTGEGGAGVIRKAVSEVNPSG